MYKTVKKAWLLSDEELNSLSAEHGELVFFQVVLGSFQNAYYYIFKK